MTGFYKDYADSSDTHQNSAEASADAAEVSATEAATSASEAATSASEAATSASEAATSLAAQENLEVTSASFDTADGTLTLTKANSGTVTADLDGRYAELTGADFTGDISFGDDVKAKFGNSDDLLIYHDASAPNRSVIEDAGAGGLDLVTNGNSIRLMTDDGEYLMSASKNSGVFLSHNNYIKLQTTIDGIRVWDDAQFDTNINVDGNIAVSGTVDGVDIAGLSTTVAGKADLSGADFTGNVTSTGTLATGGFTLPSTDGTDGQALITDGSGNVSFGDVTADVAGKADLSGATFTGDVTFNEKIKFQKGSFSSYPTIEHWQTKLGSSSVNGLFIDGEERLNIQSSVYLDLKSYGDLLRLYGSSGYKFLECKLDSGGLRTTILYHGNSNEKLRTVSDGISVTGNIAVSGTVDGVNIATLNSNAIVDGDFTTAGIMTTDGSGGYSVDASTYLTAETSHADVVVDGDFTSAGIMTTDGSGVYSVDSSTYATETYVDTAVSNLVDSAPATLDTLNELASALGDDANFSTTVTNSIGTKWTEDATKTGNWDTAYSWGDHDAVGYLTTHQDISGKANLSGASFTGNVNIGTPPSGTQSLTVAGTTALYGGVTGGLDVTGNIAVTGTVDGRDVAADGTKLDLIDPSTYLTSFDITTQTDPKYLRADSIDAAAGFIQFASGFSTSGGTFTGALNGTTASFTDDVQADTFDGDNLDINKTGNVTTNISTGALSTQSDVKTINIGTGYNNGGTTTINIAPTSASTNKNINLNGDVSISGKVRSQIDATITSPSQNTTILKLRKAAAGSNGTGRFITLNSTSTSGSDITRGIIGLSNTTNPIYTHPYISHTSSTIGIVLQHSSNSAYSGALPCNSSGIATNSFLNLGHAYAKWHTLYASSATINTSDITKKQDIEELSEAENRVAIAAKGLLRKYRWKDSVSEKGDNARIHFGIMAQDLKAAFEAEGLDASRYGMFCADTRWTTDGTDTYATEEEALEAVAEEETPEAITEETVYGVRYEELLAFIIAAI
jgi:hypothetical protein